MKQLSKGILLCGLLALLVGCANFETRVFRAEQLAVNTAHGSVKVFNHLYDEMTNNASPEKLKTWNEARDKVYEASRSFSAVAMTVDRMREQYEVKATEQAKFDLLAALDVLKNNSTNIVGLVKYLSTLPN